ncbi:MAG: phenylacetate-CoA oxygenase subunit PaaC [Gammaproteobacteria bacterium]|nr:phenylacetate-CoA oxygenase subunit PaaC [Gammaproteobacteria bacterium]
MALAAEQSTHAAVFQYLLHLADTSLILGQRLSEWVGLGPTLEDDLALGNVSLDLIGQARLLYTYAGEIEGLGRSEDDLALLRAPEEFRNLNLVEQPNGDFGVTTVRQFLFDAWQIEIFQALAGSADLRLAEIAEKSLTEARYHLRYSGGWLIRLGDGNDESHRRVSTPLEDLWKYTAELFTPDRVDEQMQRVGIGPDLVSLRGSWSDRLDEVLERATLKRPQNVGYTWFGKAGAHTDNLGHILADMQYMQRAYPGASW